MTYIVRGNNQNFLQGHDTTASSLQWTIHLLGCHSHIQSRLQKEVDGFFGKFYKNIWFVYCRLS